MTTAKEDDEDDLSYSEYFTADGAGNDLSSVSHVVYMGIAHLE